MDYQYLTYSTGGFIQQLAVCYVQRGYWHYTIGHIPAEKDPAIIDRKLLEKYQICLSKYQRCRRKHLGIANVQYLRYRNTFILLATSGVHPIFEGEQRNLQDARQKPIEILGYSVSYRDGHARVKIAQKNYLEISAYFLENSVHWSAERLAKELKSLPFEPYSPVRKQLFQLWKAVNEKRHLACFTSLPFSCLRQKRRIYRPFERPNWLASLEQDAEHPLEAP